MQGVAINRAVWWWTNGDMVSDVDLEMLMDSYLSFFWKIIRRFCQSPLAHLLARSEMAPHHESSSTRDEFLEIISSIKNTPHVTINSGKQVEINLSKSVRWFRSSSASRLEEVLPPCCGRF